MKNCYDFQEPGLPIGQEVVKNTSVKHHNGMVKTPSNNDSNNFFLISHKFLQQIPAWEGVCDYCVLYNHHVAAPTPLPPHNGTVFGDQAFKEDN